MKSDTATTQNSTKNQKLENKNYTLAERVGFEPTCPALHRTTRFRVEPGTATSVPLRNSNRFFAQTQGRIFYFNATVTQIKGNPSDCLLS